MHAHPRARAESWLNITREAYEQELRLAAVRGDCHPVEGAPGSLVRIAYDMHVEAQRRLAEMAP